MKKRVFTFLLALLVISGVMLSAGVSVASEKAAESITLSTTLYRGSDGAEVRLVQMVLKSLGYFSGKTNGEFGSSTQKAVENFQKRNKLTVTGVVDQRTFSLMMDPGAKAAVAKKATKPVVTPKPAVTPRPAATPWWPGYFVQPYATATPITYYYIPPAVYVTPSPITYVYTEDYGYVRHTDYSNDGGEGY